MRKEELLLVLTLTIAVGCSGGGGPVGLTQTGQGTVAQQSDMRLTIVGEGGNRNEIVVEVERLGGTILEEVADLNLYTARFPVDSEEQLQEVAEQLRLRGIRVQTSYTVAPPG